MGDGWKENDFEQFREGWIEDWMFANALLPESME